jgi:hypothetical protein
MFRSGTGRTHLFQVVFSRGNVSRRSYPMSRAFLYADQSPPASEPAPAARLAVGSRQRQGVS